MYSNIKLTTGCASGVWAKTTGKPYADITIPDVIKTQASTNALLDVSKESLYRRAIIVGTGERR